MLIDTIVEFAGVMRLAVLSAVGLDFPGVCGAAGRDVVDGGRRGYAAD